MIVPCFTEKYQLLHRKRECITNPRDRELWKLYREQVSYFPGKPVFHSEPLSRIESLIYSPVGEKFVTQGDISRKIEKVVDKKMCTRIAMLRQLCILQEQRKASVVCYIWIANNEAQM